MAAWGSLSLVIYQVGENRPLRPTEIARARRVAIPRVFSKTARRRLSYRYARMYNSSVPIWQLFPAFSSARFCGIMSRMNASQPNTSAESAGPPTEVLIVDNDESHAEVVAESLERVGFRCRAATSGTQGARLIEETPFDVVITDLKMSDIDGLGILKRAKTEQPDVEVILMTGHGTVPSAVEAMQQGAFNYLLKPLDLAQLRAITEKAAESSRLRRANVELNRRLDEKFGFEGVVGDSPQMRDVIERLKRIAPTHASVLIQGETGTGKELVAQAIHQNSPRKNKPFVALNCAALSENILESELFGHVKGAFTDASTDRVGKFEYAHGGTMFLDEVGDMPLATQIKAPPRARKRRDHPRRLQRPDRDQRANPLGHQP